MGLSDCKHIGDLVRRVRVDNSMSQIEFSKAIGVTQGTLSKIEGDKMDGLSAITWLTFCQKFQVDPMIYLDF